LAVDVKQLSNERIYRAQAPCAQVLEDLQQLGELDRTQEQKHGWAHIIGIGLLLGGVLVGVLGLASPTEESGLSPVAWVGLLLLVASIVSFIISALHKPLKLEKRRYGLAAHTVRLLQADISPDEPVTLHIDLRPETHPSKFQNDSRTRTGWQVKHYVDPWLSFQGRLLDGTHFRLDMTERIDMRSRTKRNARGKTKHQNRRVADALVRVRLRVKPERYQHLGRLGSRAEGAVQLLEGTRIRDLSVDPDRIDLTLVVDFSWILAEPAPRRFYTQPEEVNGVRVVATAFLSLYQILNLSRALDKKAVYSRAG
jgi:hypothetical protein